MCSTRYREGSVRPSLIPIHGYRMGGLGRDRERRYAEARVASYLASFPPRTQADLWESSLYSHNVNELFSLQNRDMTCAADRLDRIQVRQLLNRTIALRAEK